MWPLRQNVQYSKQYFFKDIFVFVFIAHLILLGVVFVSESGKFHQERFVIDTKNLQSTVVFMPLKKRVVEKHKVTASKQKNSGARKVMSHAEYKKKLAKQKKNKKKLDLKKKASKSSPVITPVEKKSTKQPVKIEPTKKPSTVLQQSFDTKALTDKEKNKKSEALAKAQADKEKVLKDKVAKAALDKKISSDAKAMADKAEKKALELKKQKLLDEKKKLVEIKALEDKKIANQKKLEEQKLEEKKQEALKKSVEKQIEKEAEPVVASVQKELIIPKNEVVDEENEVFESQDDYLDEDSISFVGSRDLEMMIIKEQIQSEIVKYYKPPIGIAKKAVCELLVVVGPHKKATRVTIKKGSGSIANDICARTALLKVPFPKEVIGKEITIALGQ